MNCTQYTIRGITKEIDQAVRQKVLETGQSLNAVLVESLYAGLPIKKTESKTNGLEAFIGSWTEDPEFDKVMDECSQVHPDEYQSVEEIIQTIGS